VKLLCLKAAATLSLRPPLTLLCNVEPVRFSLLLVGVFPWLNERRHKIMTLAARHKIPAMYPFAAFAFEGGLMSYGVGRGIFRQVGFRYVGQILKGAKPNDLPVQQPTKFELVINLRTARALGIEVPDNLLALADEVIE
jgi:putative ABC transport system substrate-binding protein